MNIFNKNKNNGYASKVEDIPKGSHFVIIRNASYYECFEDDPSNGSHSPMISYRWFMFVEDWEEEIKNLIKAGEIGFLPMKVTPATVTTTISTKVELL